MKYCPECNNIMLRSIRESITYQCRCGVIVNGSDEDVLIYFESSQKKNEDHQYLERISKDNLCYKIKESCKCKMPYLSQIITSDDMSVIKSCSNCGIIKD